MFYFQSRNPQIDFLRGIAILLVLFLHFHIAYHLDQSALNKIFSVDFLQALFRNGNYGVTMFFTISGFLITSMSLSRYSSFKNMQTRHFYILRFARIMPCLLLALAVISLLALTPFTIFHNKPNTTSMWLALFSVINFWHNVLMEKIGYFNYCLNIYWSLSVEEVFYIAFPVICLTLKKTKYLILFWTALIIIAPFYRYIHADNELYSLYGYFACFDAIAIGCCVAVIAQHFTFSKKMLKNMQLIAIITGVATYLSADIMQNIILGPSLIAFSTAILLIGAIQAEFRIFSTPNKIVKVINSFGQNSYELYLFHIIILGFIKETVLPQSLGNISKLITFIIFLSLSALLAALIAKFYSIPLNQKIRKLFSEEKLFAQKKLSLM